MSSQLDLSYGLLFHLLEYWTREESYAKMDARLRLESADNDDVETFVGLKHIKTVPKKNQKGEITNYWVQFSFPPQPHESNEKRFAFLSSGGQFETISLIGEKKTPIEKRLTNFDKGTICVTVSKSRYEESSDIENINVLTQYTYQHPREKQRALLGGENAPKRINEQLASGEITQEDAKEIREALTDVQKEDYLGLAEEFVTNPESKNATFALLRRDLPNPPLPEYWQEEVSAPTVEELAKAASSLDNSYLAIQGPPGTGKTWTGARIIHHLVTVEKKKVGITAQAWAAIDNLLEETVKYTEDELKQDLGSLNAYTRSPKQKIQGVRSHKDKKPRFFNDQEAVLVASTTWFWAHPDFSDEENKFDYLVIDEAGQLSLADALAASKGAKNIILLGDPQQLRQVSQASHPKGEGFDSGASVLGHLLGEEPTISSDRGVFLDKTWRLDPEICTFISEEFYQGRLDPVESMNRKISDQRNGLYWVPVPHDEEDPSVDENREEAEKIVEIISSLLNSSEFVEDGERRPLSIEDFMVVAPYNRQRRQIRKILENKLRIDSSTADSIVGTVDKFQGGQAPIVLYSLTTSSHDHVPKGREDFLFSPNRLNVAISRAQCMAFLVGSEALIDARANSILQMEALNHYCRYVDDLSSTWP